MSESITTLWPDQIAKTHNIGGKARALWLLSQAGFLSRDDSSPADKSKSQQKFTIPAWFVIPGESHTPPAFIASNNENPWADWRPQESLVDQVISGLETLCPRGGRAAFRSSGADEDGAKNSFAGQFETVLGVDPKNRYDVAQAIAKVVISGFDKRVYDYRNEHNLAGDPAAPTVIVQVMVPAEAAGVAFSSDPVSGQRSIAVVSAVHGLGSALVGGLTSADTFRVDRKGKVVDRLIVEKTFAESTLADGSIVGNTLGQAQAKKPAISDQDASQIAELARLCADHFGCAQDIEWALHRGRIYLLQSRPITTGLDQADPDGARQIWDNSNIAESYPGVVSPLTFTFARYVYEYVYRQFCLQMGVLPGVVRDRHNLFANMLGTARGRVYYNLLNWYRVLALLPGFSVNRKFMEQMMGVREGLPDEVLSELQKATDLQKIGDGILLGWSVSRLVLNHLTIGYRVGRFQARLDEALAPAEVPLSRMRLDELAALYRDLERKLLTRWDAPLINDFLAMIYFGTLKKLAADWVQDVDGTLQNDLICDQGDIISAEPARRLRQIAGIAISLEKSAPNLLETLCAGEMSQVRRVLENQPHLRTAGQEYIDKFGDRCMEELKLESLTLRDDPSAFWQSVGQIAVRTRAGKMPDETQARASREQTRAAAEQRVNTALRDSFWKRAVFSHVLKHTRLRVRDRENLRFERTRLFGRVREIMVQIGNRLAENHVLDSARDVFYLHVDEVLGFIEGAATTDRLGSIAAARKADYERYSAEPESAPDNRFETTGAVHQGNLFKQAARAEQSAESQSDQRKGIGCCPGQVTGIARVIVDPRGAQINAGEILVAARTDPGWVLLFPSAAGILVEHGSLLSHSAIVARELGIPAVVSINDLTTWLKTGDQISFDGKTGVVRKVTPASDDQPQPPAEATP